MRRRSLVHRLTALLSSALLLQLSLLGGGTRCRMHGEDATTGSAHGTAQAHAGHASSATATGHVAAVGDESSRTSRGPCDTMSPGASCDAPWSPLGCTSMSTCAAVASMVTPAAAQLDSSVTHAVRLVASAAIPRGPAFAPELPPPRV